VLGGGRGGDGTSHTCMGWGGISISQTLLLDKKKESSLPWQQLQRNKHASVFNLKIACGEQNEYN